MKLNHQLFLLCCILSFNLNAQIVGGREPGESPVQEVKPALNLGGNFNENVNTFTGTYGGSYNLGSLSTPGGLSFDLNLSYSSTKSVGGTESVSKGIPYGDGWNLDLPRISVESNSFRTFTYQDIQNFKSVPANNPNYNPHTQLVQHDLKEGDVYLHSIHISIPGKLNCNAIYKYTDKYGQSVFTPDIFESHAHIQKLGDDWEITLDDGTKYHFSLKVSGYRAGSNKRGVYPYESSPEMPITNPSADAGAVGTDPSSVDSRKASDQIIPKEEYLYWYCTKISNPNIPKQGIALYYKKFGAFDYFKEFSQGGLVKRYKDGLSEYASYEDFIVYKDILLNQVVSYNEFGDGDKLVLDYETDEFGGSMLDFREQSVERLDSLYNYKTIFSSQTDYFDGWKKYYHAAHDNFTSSFSSIDWQGTTLVDEMSGTNPFIKNIGGIWKYKRDVVPNYQTSLGFDHCYLESDRINSADALIPGDQYEIKTKIAGGFCNYDISVVTGENTVSSSSGLINANTYNQLSGPAKESIFSTFNSAVKWNSRGTGLPPTNQNHVYTSNYFTMPNLPTDYDGFFLQIGPANSDHVFNLSEMHALNASSSFLSAFNAYNKSVYNQSQINAVPHQYIRTYYDNVPSNFGIGMPWYMMKDIYKDMGASGTTNESNNDYKFWFKKTSTALNDATYTSIANQPTKATGTLSEVEIIRYSKNPYMLKQVRTLKAAGLVEAYGTYGYKVAKRIKLDYEIKDALMYDNRPYDSIGAPLQMSNITQHTYLLKSIEYVPTDASKSAVQLDTLNTPNNYFEYSGYGITDYNPEWFFSGSLWLMTKTTNSLGKVKEIEYSSIQDSALYTHLYKMNSDEVLSYYERPNLTKSRSQAIQITPIVRKTRITDGVGSERIMSYVYSWDKLAAVSGGGSKQLNTNDFYEKSTRLSSIGFNEVKVIETPIQGHRNYTVYEFYSSKNLNGQLSVDDVSPYIGGKQKTIRKYNANDDLIHETLFEYESLLAYENGFDRPDYDHGAWDFDYLDYSVERTGNASYLTALQNENAEIDVKFNEGQKYYEKDYLYELTDYKSYFRYLKRKTEKQYDPNACDLNSLAYQLEPEGEESEEEESILGYVNQATLENEADILQSIEETPEFSEIYTLLEENSPLSDTILKTVLTREGYPDQTDFVELLNIQPNLSDTIFHLLLTQNVLLEKECFQKYFLEREKVASNYILDLLIESSENIESSFLESFLTNNSPLNESLIEKLLTTNTAIQESSKLAILLTQDTLTEANRLNLFNEHANLSAARIEQILLEHTPYPSELVLLELINTHVATSPSNVIHVLNQSENSHSAAINTLVTANESSFSEESFNLFTQSQLNNPLSIAVCNSDPVVSNLFIESITEYDYYTATYDGLTYSEGYKDLMDVDASSFYLRYEPSWKLYKTKTYSPQYEGAYSEDKYYYYYDLKNYYERFNENYNRDIPTNLFIIETYLSPTSTFSYNYLPTFGGSQFIEFPEPDGLRNAIKYNLRNIPLQQISIKRNGMNTKPWSQTTYYEYNSRWGGTQTGAVSYDSDNLSNYNYVTPGGCPGFPGYCQSLIEFIPNSAVVIDKYTGNYVFNNVPIGKEIYHYNRNGRDYYFTIDPDNTDCLPADATLVYKLESETGTYEDIPEMMPPALDLYGAVKLHRVSVQIDTLESDAYSAFASSNNMSIYGSAKVPYFNNVGKLLPDPNDPVTLVDYEFDHFEPVYPYDVLATKTIHRRNIFTLPVLMEDEKGLKTEFDYDNLVIWTMMDDICNYNNPRFVEYGNWYMPNSIKTYTSSSNELITNYEYYPDLSVKKIIEPNLSEVLYKYNEYGNVREEWVNGNLVNQYKYGFWNGNHTLDFEERAAQNFIETIHFPNGTLDEALVSKKFIDPLSRDFQTAVGIYENGLGDIDVTSATYSGKIVYDQRDRVTASFKPFVYDESGTPFELSPQTATSYPNLYPAVSQAMAYEHEWQGRLKKAGGYGEDLTTGKFKTSDYQLLSENCFLCDLDLSYQEAAMILPKRVTADYVILKETISDEDGKTTSSYKNALGQLVATKQELSGGAKVVTLSGYDNQGNLTKVINPKNQISTYDYNMMGWMYKKETIDDGVTKYMFNKSGNVVWQQNENAVAGKLDASDNTVKPYIINYKYDEFGRLISKGEAFINDFTDVNEAYSPLLYYHLEVGDDANITEINPYFNYEFTNKSTYAWMAEADGSKLGNCTGGTCQVSKEKYSVLNGVGKVANRVFFSYNASLGNDIYGLMHPNLLTAYNTANKKGRIAYSYTLKEQDMYPQRVADSIVSITAYNYTPIGNVSMLLKQFNQNGISQGATGLVSIQDYTDYNNDGVNATSNIDINADGILDYQIHTTNDTKGRLKEIYANFIDQKSNGDKLASFSYNEAYNQLSDKYLYYSQNNTTSLVDQVTYQFDVKDRLTASLSTWMDYHLYYDNQLASLSGSTPNGTQNFNGNINGIKASYKLGTAANYTIGSGSNFDAPTVYNYTYDNLNRLTEADAVVGDYSSATVGDAEFSYDIIGNIENLKRITNTVTQEWNYLYNNNKLYQVEGVNASNDRSYTYDISGNLLSDDSRNIVDINYNTENLPIKIEKNTAGVDNVSYYQYDENGQRIFKLNYDDNAQTAPIWAVTNANYYLKDKNGTTIGILDFATEKWEWYIHGTDRIAKVNPIDIAQPLFYASDFIDWNGFSLNNSDINQISNTLEDYMQQSNPGFEQILLVQDHLENESWITDTEYQQELANAPEGEESTILYSLEFNSPQDIVILNDAQGNTYQSSIAGIYHLGSADTLPDSTHFWNNQALIGGDDGTDIDWDDGETGGGTPSINPSPISFYRYDHLGNTRVVYQSEWDQTYSQVKNTIIGAYDYFPYGKILREFNPQAERYLTTQHERDQETEVDGYQGTGLDNRGARFYDSEVARFLSLDPAAAEYPSLSDYNYVAGNPVIFIDPDGRNLTKYEDEDGNEIADTDDGRDIVVTVPDEVKSNVEFMFSKTSEDNQNNLEWNQRLTGFIFDNGGSWRQTNWGLTKEMFSQALGQWKDPHLIVIGLTGAFSSFSSLSSATRNIRNVSNASVAMSETQLVLRAAQKAEKAIGGTGRFAGTAKHAYAKNLLIRHKRIYGNDLSLGTNYFNNGVGNRGFLDVANHSSGKIYDFKFGTANWSPGQLQKYQRNFPGYDINIVRP